MRYRYLFPLLMVCLSGCAFKKDIRDARKAMQQQKWDQAYHLWGTILEKEPGHKESVQQQERARMEASLEHLQKANVYFSKDQLAEAKFEASRVLFLDPANQEAIAILKRVETREAAIQAEAERLTAPNDEASYSNVPVLNPKTWGPQNIYFPKATDVRDIYTAIGRAYHINILVDPKIRSEKLSLDLRNLSFLKALDTLMVLNRHFFKVIDTNTLIILEDNKQIRERYENQIIRTFYLSNITPADLKAHLRQLGLKEFAENERLNAVTIKGTPEQVALAERVISANDKSQPEVVIEIEILEVNKNNLRRLGILPVGPDLSTPTYRAGVIADPVGRSDDDRDSNGIRGIFPSLNSNDYLTIVPALAIDLLKESGGSKQVDNPHLRVTSGEEAHYRVGQSIPIANTSFTTPQLSGSVSGTNNFGEQALTTFNYNDVGISIKAQPRVHFNNEITLTLELEISSVVTGGLQPVLGKRQLSTTVRLKNGETNVMAGLLTNTERKSLTGIPGLSDLPILGRLFSNNENIVNTTDIIMTIRPIIVRGINVFPEDRAPHEIADIRLSTLYAKAQKEEKKPDQADALRNQAWSRDQAGDENGGQDKPPAQPRAFEPNTGYDTPSVAAPSSDDVVEDGSFGEEPEEGEPPPIMLSFTPLQGSARQDEEITVQIFLTNAENVRKGEVSVSFDPAVLQAESIEAGELFNARGERPLVTSAWNNETGRFSLILSQRRQDVTFSGSGILANVRFRAKAPGTSSLAFAAVRMEDPGGNTIETQGLEGSFDISP